jgi:S-adenosylmethionine/arginine decarboxylase-like enzyme
VGAPFAHLSADLVGVPRAQLADAALLGGVAIAAAAAAGVHPVGAPLVRQRPDGGVTFILALEGTHLALHSDPERGLLLLDVLAPTGLDPRTALEVFARRLTAREVRSEVRERG